MGEWSEEELLIKDVLVILPAGDSPIDPDTLSSLSGKPIARSATNTLASAGREDLRVRLIDEHGNPLAGHDITASNQFFVFNIKTDTDGKARKQSIQSGVYLLQVGDVERWVPTLPSGGTDHFEVMIRSTWADQVTEHPALTTELHEILPTNRRG